MSRSISEQCRHHAPSFAGIALAVVGLFRFPLFQQFRFVGDSDRWNHFLSLLYYEGQGFSGGHPRLWGENLFLGFDLRSLPFSGLLHPVHFLYRIGASFDLIQVSTLVTLFSLFLSLLLAYSLGFYLFRKRLIALAVACVYSLSQYAILKLSQNDNTFWNFLFAPAMFWLVLLAKDRKSSPLVLLMGALVWLAVYSVFLQEFAYSCFFLLCFAMFEFIGGRRRPLGVLCAGMALGLVAASPRIFSLAHSLQSSDRGGVAWGVNEEVSFRLFLRYLQGWVFGLSAGHQLDHVGTATALPNFSEGNLMHSSIFGSLVVLLALLGTIWKALRRRLAGGRIWCGPLFYAGFVVVAFLVMHYLPAYYKFSGLFLFAPFMHGRLGFAALLPASLLLARELSRRDRFSLRSERQVSRVGLGLMSFGLIVVSAPAFLYGDQKILAPHGIFWSSPGLSPLFIPALVQWAVLALTDDDD